MWTVKQGELVYEKDRINVKTCRPCLGELSPKMDVAQFVKQNSIGKGEEK
jgi:hypothetical protein